MKKKNKIIPNIIKTLFSILWLIRIPIVSVSVLLVVDAFFLSNYYNYIFPSISVMFMLFFGYIINDIMDIEIDRISAPQRPLPSGKISITSAKKLLVLFSVISIIFAVLTKNILFNIYIVIYGFMFWFYTKYLKTNWFIKNVVTALFFSSLSFVPILFDSSYYDNVCYLFVITFIFTFGREMLMDVRDNKGDKMIKNNKRLKVKYSIALSSILIILSFVLSDIFFFSTYICRYISIILICFLFILVLKRKPKLWLCTECVKIAFLINLFFLFIEANI